MVKITSSIQEWCGQSYTQLNRRGNLKISSHSYFEDEADQNINLNDNLTEDEIWTLIRTQPELLPKGKILILPSIEYLQLNHKKIKFYEAEASIIQKEGINTYLIIYPELQRKHSISFKNVRPYGIIEWAEYDLRFPELFRSQHEKEIEVIILPASFTEQTGKVHWDTLVKARAIENLSYVVTSCQGGYHINGKKTYGHTMIVSPWGKTLDSIDKGKGFISSEIDLIQLKSIRQNFPVLDHMKLVKK